jgi:hypothetical protein
MHIMKTSQEILASKVPIVQIDSSLEKYRNKVLFPEKLAKANALLKTVKLPKKNTPKKNIQANLGRRRKIKTT